MVASQVTAEHNWKRGWPWLLVTAIWVGCGEGRPKETDGDADDQAETDVDAVSGDVQEDSDDSADEGLETGETNDADLEAVDSADIDDVRPRPAVVINEFDCHEDWVELLATGTVDLAGLELGDGERRMALSGTLAAGEFRVVKLDGFGLACGREGPVLSDGDETLDLGPPDEVPAGFTRGRFPDGVGEFVITEPTEGVTNRLPEVDPFDPAAAMFGAMREVATIDLELDPSSFDSLNYAPYTWVPGRFAWTEDGTRTEFVPVALRLKGRIGSFRDLYGKSGFKLDFGRFHPGGEFRGLETMTLNNMVQDYHRVNEVRAYDLFRRMGVPAPRLSYVWVRVNGEDFGLYLNLESLDHLWRSRHFESTLGMFEGQYGEDLFVGTAFRMDLDGGDESARLALDEIAQAIANAPADGFMAHLAPWVDWDEVLAMMATEVFIGHWDGYSPTRNNYFVHLDDDGVLRLIPWGLDQTFGADIDLYGGAGLLLEGCMRDPVCRFRWEDTLSELADVVKSEAYRTSTDGLVEHLQPWLDREPREDAGEARIGLDSASEFLDFRANRVIEALACTRDPLSDRDGDGYKCGTDCNEEDPSVHVGADDLCNDGIDQDCNGRPDDGRDCPDCFRETGIASTYEYCRTARTFETARAECQGRGGDLVQFESQSEVLEILAAMNRLGLGDTWIGLTDLEEEGVWRWLDGTLYTPDIGGFLDGEPNDWLGAEDCGQMVSWGGDRPWNDIDCLAYLPMVCEFPLAR